MISRPKRGETSPDTTRRRGGDISGNVTRASGGKKVTLQIICDVFALNVNLNFVELP